MHLKFDILWLLLGRHLVGVFFPQRRRQMNPLHNQLGLQRFEDIFSAVVLPAQTIEPGTLDHLKEAVMVLKESTYLSTKTPHFLFFLSLLP